MKSFLEFGMSADRFPGPFLIFWDEFWNSEFPPINFRNHVQPFEIDFGILSFRQSVSRSIFDLFRLFFEFRMSSISRSIFDLLRSFLEFGIPAIQFSGPFLAFWDIFEKSEFLPITFRVYFICICLRSRSEFGMYADRFRGPVLIFWDYFWNSEFPPINSRVQF